MPSMLLRVPEAVVVWVEFLITSLIVVVAPGTGVIYTVGVGLARGTAASFAAAAGCTFGIIPHMAAAIAGLMRWVRPPRP